MMFADRLLLRGVVGALVLFFSRILVADPSHTPDTEIQTKKQIQRLVRQLNDDNFGTRQAAVRRLIEIGNPAVQAVKNAAKDPSAEVRFRVSQVLSGIKQNSNYFVNLAPKSNRTLNQKFGRFDGNTLESMPRGVQQLGGMRFKIADKILLLGSKLLPDLPRKIEGIAVDRKCAQLCFLHSMGFGGDNFGVKDGDQIAKYSIRYEDRTHETISVEFGVDYLDFWVTGESKPLKRGKVVWTGKNQLSELRIYGGRWKNPHPDKKITSLDFIATHETGAPFCLAITAEDKILRIDSQDEE